MKKLLCMLLALILVIGLCACGHETPDHDDDDTPKGENTSQTSQETTEAKGGETTDPSKLESIRQVTFSVNGKQFHLGMKLSQLMDSGVFTKITSPDDTLEAIESGGATATLDAGGKLRITLYLWNLSRNTIDIKDATVVGLSYSLDGGKDAIATMVEVSLAGAKLNDSIDGLTAIFGEPNDRSYTYENESGRGGSWRGFDIGEEFRLYIRTEQPTGQPLNNFTLQFKPFTDSIK